MTKKILILSTFWCLPFAYGKAAYAADTTMIYVISHGWHTGIVLPSVEIPDSLMDLTPYIGEYRFFEFGWGDLDYYQNREFNFFDAVKAVLWPTKSTIHLVAFDKPVTQYFSSSEIIRFAVPGDSFLEVCRFIQGQFARDSTGAFIELGKGHYMQSRFFLGEESYYYPNTCNVWTARVLKVAGIPVVSFNAQFAEDLIRQIKPYGVLVSDPDKN